MTIDTDRLLIQPLSQKDNNFIFELLNTDGWIKYIGNRNIYSESDAIAYINKINDSQNITYWTIKLKNGDTPIGLVTLIKREHLDFRDIGFAFLPEFTKKGYAHEATKAILFNLVRYKAVENILAITLRENSASIKLIEKLGFKFKKTFNQDEDILNLYYASREHLLDKQ
jgi:ribosomal-protein-alanine N-acetyltransferase